jgi:hypothetical protein
LCPGHGCPALRRRWIWCLFKCLNLSTLAPPGRCDQRPVLAIRCEHTRDGFAPLLLTRAFGIPGALLRLRRNRTPSIAGSARKTCGRSRLHAQRLHSGTSWPTAKPYPRSRLRYGNG